jgi:hypothetical protein
MQTTRYITKISRRNPSATSRAFDNINTKKFFDFLQEQIVKHHIQSHCIFHVHETATGTITSQNSKIISHKGQHQVSIFTSDDHSQNVTAVLYKPARG